MIRFSVHGEYAGAGLAVVSGHAAQGGIMAALAVFVLLVLFVMRRVGDLVPAVIMLGTAAFVVWVLPYFPGSPVAFLNDPHANPSQGQLDWLVGLAFVGPVALAAGYKARRGDKRGVTGDRPVFRGRPK